MTHADAGAAPAEAGRRRMIRNFGALFFGRLSVAFSMWLALIILAKLADPATVGLYALAQAICVPVAEVAKAGLREIMASDPAGLRHFGAYLRFRMAAGLLAFGAVAGFALLSSPGSAVLAVILVYGLVRVAEMMSDILHGAFQTSEEMTHIGWSLCLLGAGSLAGLGLGYALSGSLLVAVAGQLAAHLAVLAAYDLPVARRLGVPFGGGRAAGGRSLLVHATPLAVGTLMAMVAVYLPRIAVERWLDLQALGFFAAITALAMAPNRFVNAIGVAASVRLARLHAAGDRRAFLTLLGRLAGLVVLGGAVGLALIAVAGDAILRLVYTPDYAAYRTLFLLAFGAAVLRSLADVLKFGMIAARRFWWVAAQYGTTALVAALGCVLLIPDHGLTGAGVALVLIFLANVVVVAVGVALSLPDPKDRP